MTEHPAIRKLKEALTSMLITEGRRSAPPCSDPDHGKPWHCCHSVSELRKFTTSNGGTVIHWWCTFCGSKCSQAIARSAISQELLPTILEADDEVRSCWEATQRDMVAKMYQRVERDEGLTDRQIRYAEFIKSPEWRKLRNRRLQLDGYVCADCGGSATTAHHTWYPEEEHWGETPLWALISLCEACHEKAHRIFGRGRVPWN